jgi:chitin disaccharide deacetylase
MKTENKYLMINADDFGMSKSINQAIIEGIHRGVITSVSLLANGPAFDSVSPCCLSNASVGLHAVFTFGKPVLPPDSVASLVDDDGCFYDKSIFLLKYLTGRISLAEMENELLAQLGKTLDSGFNIDHLNSHHHLHCLPAVYKMFNRVAGAQSIRFIRTITSPLWNRKALWTMFFFSFLHKLFNTGFKTENAFWGFELMRAKEKKPSLEYILNHLKPGMNELMCHPAKSAKAAFDSYYKTGRYSEYRLLMDHLTLKRILDRGIQLVSYRHLLNQKRKSGRD